LVKALNDRVWAVGKWLVLVGALGVTFLLSATLGMRFALEQREVQVPQLVGRTIEDASAQVSALGLTLQVDEAPRIDPIVPRGRIMQQDPGAGLEARTRRAVRVWLSAGQTSTTVPVLVGQTERTARIRLQQDQLTLATVAEFRSPDYAADAVVAQDPPPASLSPAVSLLVNRGEQATTFVLPDVIGMDGLRAADALRARGFRVTIVGSQPYPGVPPGTVVRQEPAGGFQVGASEAISLEISR
jgi:beta-lactam-binding protein with PASTA domain